MKIISITVLLLYVFLFSQARAQSEASDEFESERLKYTCSGEQIQGVAFRYCYRDLSTTNSNDIIYFFHGLEGSEETWFTQYLGTLLIQKWWKHWGYRPRIVTVSFGPQWLLVNNQRYPLLPLFLKKIMPFLEKKVGGLKMGHRHLIGQSMGGFNAAEVALQSPGTFQRVALLCPAITTVGPYSSDQEIESYIDRTGAQPKLVRRMLAISRAVFLNQADWVRHDPLLLLKKYRDHTKSKFYISVGLDDGYGFQEGAHQFYLLAKTEAFFSKWLPVPGGHCSFNRLGTARFIMGD